MKRRRLIFLVTLGVLALGEFVVLPHALPMVLARYRPDIRFAVQTNERMLYVTIDDAPSTNTTEILRVLQKHGVPATFFVIADRVAAHTQLDEIIAAGHSLGNHLKTTKACSKLSLAEFQSDFDVCSGLLDRRTKPLFFRPASDFGTREQIAYAKSKGYQAVMGTVFPLYHWLSDPDWLVRISAWLSVPGGILILHDGDPRGRTAAEVLDNLIPMLKAKGYLFGKLGSSPPDV